MDGRHRSAGHLHQLWKRFLTRDRLEVIQFKDSNAHSSRLRRVSLAATWMTQACISESKGG